MTLLACYSQALVRWSPPSRSPVEQRHPDAAAKINRHPQADTARSAAVECVEGRAPLQRQTAAVLRLLRAARKDLPSISLIRHRYDGDRQHYRSVTLPSPAG